MIQFNSIQFQSVLKDLPVYYVVGKENATNLHKNPNNTNELQSVSSTTTRRPFYQTNRLPCSCNQIQCGCCTGVILETFNQKACMNFTYEPDDFSIGATMTMNNRVIYKNTFSGK